MADSPHGDFGREPLCLNCRLPSNVREPDYEVVVVRREFCDTCGGHGDVQDAPTEPSRTCEACGGSGRRVWPDGD